MKAGDNVIYGCLASQLSPLPWCITSGDSSLCQQQNSSGSLEEFRNELEDRPWNIISSCLFLRWSSEGRFQSAALVSLGLTSFSPGLRGLTCHGVTVRPLWMGGEGEEAGTWSSSMLDSSPATVSYNLGQVI